MDKLGLAKQRLGISPIIATLVLIVIAIAAGVVVYAYVVGFVGNSTSNEGATINTLSIDQFTASSNPNIFPVNVYVRNHGPSTEGFNTGFYVKGTSINDQFGIAISISSTIANKLAELTISSTSSAGVLHVTLICTGTSAVTIYAFGVSGSGSCGTSRTTTSVPSTSYISGVTFSNSTSHGMIGSLVFGTGISLSTNANSPTIIGVPVTQGATINLFADHVLDIPLALPMANGTTSSSSNPLSAGETYSIQVTGTDGASTTASGRAS